MFYKDNCSVAHFIKGVKRIVSHLFSFNLKTKGGNEVEELVRTVLSKYTGFLAEAELYERWLSARENPEIRNALTLLEMKITAIQSWFNLLNADERFVIQKHLIEELEWPRVAFEFAERWKQEFSRTERSLVHYQASAIKKIVDFSSTHKDIVLALFGDLMNASCVTTD